MKKVFIVNGMGGCGKDTFVACVGEIVPTMHISIVEKTKEIARTLGWTGSKTEKDRLFLYELKAALDHFSDYNYEYIKGRVRDFYEGKLDNCEVLCIDIREKYQVERARKEFNAEVVLVRREGIKNITTNTADANVFDIEYDIYVDNNGTIEDLKQTAKEFVQKYVNI